MQTSILKTLRDVPLRRGGVAKLADSLRELHWALVEDAKATYQSAEGPVAGPGELLQLLTQHEAFAWIRPLSSRMAELEHAEAKGDDEQLRDELIAVEGLFAPSSSFAARYFEVLQRSPEVVMLHAATQAALRGTRLVD